MSCSKRGPLLPLRGGGGKKKNGGGVFPAAGGVVVYNTFPDSCRGLLSINVIETSIRVYFTTAVDYFDM